METSTASTQDTRRFVVRGSLRDMLSIPQRTTADFSKQPLPEAVKRVQASWDSFEEGHASPDFDALTFYCLNHLVSMIQQKFHEDERLPDWARGVVQKYVGALVGQAHRMYTYLVLITTRENRHQGSWATGLTKKHAKKFGDAAAALKEFHNTWCKKYDELKSIKNLMAHPPEVTLGEYVTHLTFSFDNGGWGASFGGKKWGVVSKCLEDTVHGRISLEMMVDVGYALAHNGGPIFNKGMTYMQHGGKDFLRLLDLQRSGFVPTAVLLGATGPVAHLYESQKSEFHALMVLCKTVQEEIGGIPEYVDYYKVAAFGVCGSYDYEKKKQVADHGLPEVTEYKKPEEPEEVEEDEEKSFDDEVEEEIAKVGAEKPYLTPVGKPVHVYPGQTVYAIDSKRESGAAKLYGIKLKGLKGKNVNFGKGAY